MCLAAWLLYATATCHIGMSHMVSFNLVDSLTFCPHSDSSWSTSTKAIFARRRAVCSRKCQTDNRRHTFQSMVFNMKSDDCLDKINYGQPTSGREYLVTYFTSLSQWKSQLMTSPLWCHYAHQHLIVHRPQCWLKYRLMYSACNPTVRLVYHQ